jgi:hypothetical protein
MGGNVAKSRRPSIVADTLRQHARQAKSPFAAEATQAVRNSTQALPICCINQTPMFAPRQANLG